MMKLTTALVVLGLALAATPADAQSADVPPRPPKGTPRVIVTDRNGLETIGRLVSWTGSSIVITTKGATRTYAPGEAVRVDLRHDSVKNGAIIGAAFGSIGGLIADCPGGGSSCGASRVAFTLLGIGVWAAIGAGIDALIPGRSPLWSSGAPAKSARGLTFNISPRERRASIGWRLQLP